MNATDNRPASCAERISGHMLSREGYLTELFEKIDSADSEEQDSAQEELDSFGLGMSTKVLLRVDISTGGPADYLTVICERGRYGLNVESVTYHFADWFDHAEQRVETTSPLYRYAERCAEYAGMSEDS